MIKEAIRPVKTKAFMLAMSLLDLPVGPTYKELSQQAKSYIKGLDEEEREKLKAEALTEGSKVYKDDYADKLELFDQLLFTPREAQAYAGMRLDSPGVRRVVAKRALLGALRGWERLPKGMLLHDVLKWEDAYLKDKSEEQIMEQIRRIKGRR
jgi:hypothetical protein